MQMLYTNINVKSHYTLLKSSLRIDDLISFAQADKQKYVCLCDKNFLGGSIELIKKCEALDLTPIIGLEVEVNYENNLYTALVYAKNLSGYHQLINLSSFMMLNDSLNLDTFNSFISDDLVVVIDLTTSPIYAQYLIDNKIDNQLLIQLKKLFSTNYFFCKNTYESDSFKSLFDEDLILLAANPIYCNEYNQQLVYLLNCINTNKLADDYELSSSTNQISLIKTFEAVVHYTKREISNLNDFLKLFNKYTLAYENTLPDFCDNPREYLKRLSLKGLEKRLNNQVSHEYLKRLEYELSIIFEMGYENYFLIVYDYVLFAKKNKILVGPGRGSAAGSLVAYCLGITDVDPIENELIFERFLNPQRISMPDIDIDFEDDRRQDIIDYLKLKYGPDHVSHILTYNTFQAKNSLRDLAKVLNIPNHQLNLILDLFPKEKEINLRKFKETSKQLNVYFNQYPQLKQLYYYAMQAQGLIKNYSTHAAGLIISKDKIIDYVPIMPGIADTLMTQYSMHYLESMSLYKMDILGLKNLSMVKEIINKISENFKIEQIPLNDAKTLALMNEGKTIGVFQFESEGVINVLKKMNITSINDLMATTALHRPGPMQQIDTYIRRSNKSEPFTYLHPNLKPILESTYGIIVYQEQIMQITQAMAGFTLAKADLVRKAMSKKNETALKEIKEEFINASVNNGYSFKVANEVYEMILEFANYGFNKAHAYSYALFGYQMAYLKAHYPQEFYQTILSANLNNENKFNNYLFEIKSLGLEIKVPNLNKSTLVFEVANDDFILPLNAIKGLGKTTAQIIIEERNNNGLYQDFVQAVVRLVTNKIDETTIRSLISAGAFDDFEYNRTTMLENLSHVFKYAKLSLNKDGLFVDDTVELGKIYNYADSLKIVQKNEYEALGIYLSTHPLDIYREEYPQSFLRNIPNNRVLVIVDQIKEIRTKKGEQMAFVSVSDGIENKTLVLFPNIYQRYQKQLAVNDILLIKGSVDEKNTDNIIVKDLKILNERQGSDE